ncbi:MAG TPA: bifunctional diguanylate cyclase/phosphodiesterase [Nitrospirota bacterium]|nr:bifunctional diguanylate cyclase/phosphodiesterase [Nitrospirota bacterium]
MSSASFSHLWFRGTKSSRVMKLQSRLIKEIGRNAISAKRWRNQVKNILVDAADIVDIYFLYAFLIGEDDKRDIELFWLKTPSPETAKDVEGMLQQKVAESDEFMNIRDFNIIHSTALSGSSFAPIRTADIELLDKTFHINMPLESGFVGLGIPARARLHLTDLVVIESVLAAFVNVISSVKTLAAYTRDVERFATRDPLTNLYNQISFWDLLEYETSRSKRQEYKFSLLVTDIDNFKVINDTYGHEIGDNFLKEFSTILKSTIRSGDIAARYYGDQFAAILPVCDEGQARIVARRIIEGVRNHSFPLMQGVAIKGTVSIGIAVYPDNATEAKDLFLLADNMLTQSKSFGKDRLSMPSEQDNVEVIKSMGEKNILILEALAQHRIIPYFQPIMNISDHSINAYEVLTRIGMNDRIIPAAEFIETAEGMGAIGRIDYQLFERALAKVRESSYQGNLFINLSPKALVLNEFMPTIRKMLRDYGLDPSKLIFEITERDTVKNLKLIASFITELEQEGFRFAIDDFGSGYSSFHYIKTFRIDYLKVDGEFVRNMGGSNSIEKEIVTSIATLASRLGIQTIAEYVESEEILANVESAGINYAQGYYIKRPSPDLP